MDSKSLRLRSQFQRLCKSKHTGSRQGRYIEPFYRAKRDIEVGGETSKWGSSSTANYDGDKCSDAFRVAMGAAHFRTAPRS
eukprot:1630169-Prymnesium_polylepis.1